MNKQTIFIFQRLVFNRRPEVEICPFDNGQLPILMLHLCLLIALKYSDEFDLEESPV